MAWAPPTMADTGTIDTPQNVYSVVMYIMYADFGAFTYHKVKDWFGMPLHCYCPVGLVLPLHYSAIIEEVAAICTKGGGFYHENFSKQYSGAIFRRNTCFE